MLVFHLKYITSHHITSHHIRHQRILLILTQYTAAQYYRLAEQNGSKTLGNSW